MNDFLAHQKLKEYGYETIDFISDTVKKIESNQIPVRPNVIPGSLAKSFQEEAPKEPTEFPKLLEEIEELILPGVTHWQHPHFFGYFPASTSVPAILSEAIISTLGSVGLQWASNPIATELEVVVMDWVAKMIGLGGDFLHTSGRGGGLIQHVAGEAVLNIIGCAKYEKQKQLLFPDLKELNEEQREQIFYSDSSKLVCYLSNQTHFCGPKACRILGIRHHKIEPKLLENGNYGITAEDVEIQIEKDIKNGLIPTCILLNYGTTNTTGFDQIKEFENIKEKYNIWIHIDAAYAGSSLILPQFQERTKDIEKIGTSFNFNGSKWFLMGFDSAFLFVKDRKLLTQFNSATGDYMAEAPNSDQIYSPEFKDWAIPLGRRFRALRIWMVIKYFGINGIQKFLQNGIDIANILREKLEKNSNFDLPVITELGLVCFKLKEGSKYTQKLAEKLIENKNYLLFPSNLNGETIIRIALGGVFTSEDHLEKFWKFLLEKTEETLNEN